MRCGEWDVPGGTAVGLVADEKPEETKKEASEQAEEPKQRRGRKPKNG